MISTAVEGVETPEHLAKVRALGNAEMRGYPFGPPMRADDAERMIARTGADCEAA
jgi:predicted signal transduction protein with EAL and GGDEF domain